MGEFEEACSRVVEEYLNEEDYSLELYGLQTETEVRNTEKGVKNIMDNQFPKYQYSVFMKNGRDQQIVVRSNDKAEFMTLIKDIQGIAAEPQLTPDVEPEPVRESTAGMFCMACKAPAVQKSGTKNGNTWNAIFCSSENRTHTKWL